MAEKRELLSIRLHVKMVRGTIEEAEAKINEFLAQSSPLFKEADCKRLTTTVGDRVARELGKQPPVWMFLLEEYIIIGETKRPLNDTCLQVKTITAEGIEKAVDLVNKFADNHEVTRIHPMFHSQEGDRWTIMLNYRM